MKNLPHDFYLKNIDHSILDEIVEFHTKGNFIFDPLVTHATTLHHLTQKQLELMTGNELRIFPGKGAKDIPMENPIRPISSGLVRDTSCGFFAKKKFTKNEVDLLVQPFLVKDGDLHRRGYPSGGALYPIELFICDLTGNEEWDGTNILHLLPASKRYEVVSGASRDLIKSALVPEGANIGSPSIAMIYVAYLPKTIFKYRYRGYRLALMEVGSMYMLLDLHCKSLGFANRVWSAYTDYAVIKHLRLNPALFHPLGVQLVGIQ